MSKAGVSVAAAVVVLGGAYLGATAYTGGMVRKEYEAALDKTAQALPMFKIVDRKYDKGFFSSTATYSVQIGCDAAAVVTVRDTIAHGPFPAFAGAGLARVDTRIVLPPEAPASLRAWVDGMPPDAVRTTVAFNGATDTRVSLPAGEVKDSDAHLQWQPMHAAFRVNGARTDAHYDFDVPEVTFDLSSKGKTVNFKLVNLRGQVEGASAAGDMLFGNGSGTVTLDQLHAGSAEGDLSLDLNQLRYTTKSAVEQELLQASESLTGAADVKVAGKAVKLDKIEIQESMKRLHMPTLRQFAAQSWLGVGSMCRKSPADLAQSMRQNQAALLAGMKQLLIYNPEYSVDKVAVTYQGQEGTLAYSAAIHGVTNADLQAPDPRGLINKVTAKASARVPVAWVEKIVGVKGRATPEEAHQVVDAAIGNLVNKGYATREGDYLSSAALFDQGQLTVNGKPVPLPPMASMTPPMSPPMTPMSPITPPMLPR